MAPTDLVGERELAGRIDELIAGGKPCAVLGARVELPADEPSPVETVSGRLLSLVRGTDLLGLVPPHTFVVVASGSDAASAELVAERMKQAFQMPLEVEGRVVSLVVDQRVVLVRPEDMLRGAPSALSERRGTAAGDGAPLDGAGALAGLLALLDRPT